MLVEERTHQLGMVHLRGLKQEQAERRAAEMGLIDYGSLLSAMDNLALMAEACARSGGALNLEMSDPAVSKLVAWLTDKGVEVDNRPQADQDGLVSAIASESAGDWRVID